MQASKSLYCLFFLLLLFNQDLFSQNSDKDFLNQYYTSSENITIHKTTNTSFSHFFPGILFKAYKQLISKQFSANCQFAPSCSEYSNLLIEEYGLLKGSFLTVDRLTRCNPISIIDTPGYHFHPIDGKIHETVAVYKWKKE